LLYYKFIIQLAGERIFKIGQHLAKLRTRLWSLVFFDSVQTRPLSKGCQVHASLMCSLSLGDPRRLQKQPAFHAVHAKLKLKF